MHVLLCRSRVARVLLSRAPTFFVCMVASEVGRNVGGTWQLFSGARQRKPAPLDRALVSFQRRVWREAQNGIVDTFLACAVQFTTNTAFKYIYICAK